MRPIHLRLLPALLAGVLLLACAGSAPAASFPCGSFLHQLRHGKLRDAIQGEGVVSQEVARFKKGVARDEASNLPEPTKTGKTNSDKTKLTEWTAHLRYLKALDARIGAEQCDHFHYANVLQWIRHRSGHLHADRFKLAGDGSVKAGRRIAYDTGGLDALDPAGVRIKQIAVRQGVRIAAAADDSMPGAPGPPAPPTGGAESAVPVVMAVDHIEPRSVFFRGGIPAYIEPVTTEIQYGLTTAYGQTSTPYQPPPGHSDGLDAEITGLSPATTYHWRFAVLKASGNVYTPDATVTTLPPGPVALSSSSHRLHVTSGRAQITIVCFGDPGDSCQGHASLSATQLVQRHHRRIRQPVQVASAAFVVPIRTDMPAPYARGGAKVPITLTRAGRKLLAPSISFQSSGTSC